jgi:hypothetical protein
MKAARASTCASASFDWGYLIVFGLTLPVLWPLVGPAYLSSHDGLHHLFRLLDLDWCLRGGVLYPRWLPHLGFGYGYPVLNYYAPLSYYVAEALHVLGTGFVDSIKLTYALGFLGSGLSMYLFARQHLGRWPGILAGVVYVYLPYHLADAYVRGALAEFLTFPFFPLILWSFSKLMTTRKIACVGVSALALAGLMVTHNLIALIFAPLLVAYVGFLWFRERDLKAAGLVAGALLLALGLAAFYWLPGFVESTWARLGVVGPQATDYLPRLITMKDFFSPYLVYRYFPEHGVSLEHPMSWLQFGLLCSSLLVPLRLRHQSWANTRRQLIFFLWGTFVTLLMLFVYSQPMWDHVPLLSYLQYPFRFLTLTTFTSAFAIGSLPLLLVGEAAKESVHSPARRGRSPAGLVLALVIVGSLMLTALPRLPIEPQHMPEHEEPLTEASVTFQSMAEYDYLTGLWARLWGGAWMMEYLPAWVQDPPSEIFLPVEKPDLQPQSLPAQAVPEVTVSCQAPLSLELETKTQDPMSLSFHSFYFPNWQIHLDGSRVRPYPSGKLGLLTVDVPPGEHHLLVHFVDTPVERAGTILLLASLGALVAILALARQWRVLLAALVTMLALLALTALHAFSSPTVQNPVAVEADLESQVKLLGYDLDKPNYRAGDTIGVTLYWLALQEMDQDYKVFVHLTDEGETRLVAQSDRWPVYNFSPTTRWQPGEIVWDRHEILIPGDAAPGTYSLSTGMYLLETMRNLNVLGEDGSAQGVSVPLVSVQIRQ